MARRREFERALHESLEDTLRPLRSRRAAPDAGLAVADIVATNPVYERELANCGLESLEWKRYALTYRALAERFAGRRFAVLDVGAGVGLVARLAQHLGAMVTALDNYRLFGTVQAGMCNALKSRGIGVVTADLVSSGGALPLADGTFDVVLLLAVIEHLPHSPRALLRELRRVLKPGGILILDTPNLGAFIKRLRMLVKGKGPFFDIEDFFRSTPPWTGHFREFNARELRYMLGESRFSILDLKRFNVADFRHASLKFSLFQGPISVLVPSLRDSIWIAAQKDQDS